VLILGKRPKHGIDLLHSLFKKQLISVKEIQSVTGLSPKAANDLTLAFVNQKNLRETTGYQRNRMFAFYEYINLFNGS
jgi:hypothetical protein